MKEEYKEGIADITRFIKENFHTDVSTRHIHRLLTDKTIPSEPRVKGSKEVFRTNINSLEALGNPDCDMMGGIDEMTYYSGIPERTIRRQIKQGNLPVDRFLGRHCTTSNSLYAYLLEYRPKNTAIFTDRWNKDHLDEQIVFEVDSNEEDKE